MMISNKLSPFSIVFVIWHEIIHDIYEDNETNHHDLMLFTDDFYYMIQVELQHEFISG